MILGTAINILLRVAKVATKLYREAVNAAPSLMFGLFLVAVAGSVVVGLGFYARGSTVRGLQGDIRRSVDDAELVAAHLAAARSGYRRVGSELASVSGVLALRNRELEARDREIQERDRQIAERERELASLRKRGDDAIRRVDGGVRSITDGLRELERLARKGAGLGG